MQAAEFEVDSKQAIVELLDMHILEVTQNVHSGEALIQVVQSVILLEQTLTETAKT